MEFESQCAAQKINAFLEPEPFQKMSSLLFDLLSTDLQIHVLFVWLNNEGTGCDLMRTLSALDIACAMSCQRSCRDLLSHIPPFGGFSPAMWPKEGTTYIRSYMLWLCSRRVAVRSLVLRANSVEALTDILHGPDLQMVLPLVEVISIDGGFDVLKLNGSRLVQAVSRCCPNATSLLSLSTLPFTDAIMSALPKLKVLTINSSSYIETFPTPLKTFPPQLQELRLCIQQLAVRTATLLAKYCPLLRVLEVDLPTSFWTLLQLLDACKHLQDLKLRGYITEANLTQILVKPQVRRLRAGLGGGTNNKVKECTVFANLLELRPDIEELQFHHCKYHAHKRAVSSTASFNITEEDLSRILAGCNPLDSLALQHADFQEGFAEVISRMCCGRLTALAVTMRRRATRPLEIVLQNCPLLTSLQIDDNTTDAMLALIAAHCPRLEILWLESADKQSSLKCDVMTDEGLDSLFAFCPLIQHLTLVGAQGSLTVKTLESIFHRRLPLRLLQLVRTDFPSDIAHWIRYQAKLHHLLPPPKVEVWSR